MARAAERAAPKEVLLELSASTDGGVAPLAPADRARLDEIALELLPVLSPTAEPARDAAFSGEWEPVWTDEKEIDFSRARARPLRPGVDAHVPAD